MRWQASADPECWLAALDSLVKEARPAIERDGDAAARAAVEHAAGYVDINRCRYSAAMAAFTRAMQYAQQAGDLWFETSMRAMAGACVYLGPTPISEALPWLDNAKAQSATYQPQLDTRQAALLAELGRFSEARSLLAETIAQMNERGLALLAGYAMQTAWRIEMLAGDDAAAERVARRGCEQLERLEEHAWLSTQSCQLADALYALGRYDEAEQWALRGLKLGSGDDLATQFLGRSVRIETARPQGRPQRGARAGRSGGQPGRNLRRSEGSSRCRPQSRGNHIPDRRTQPSERADRPSHRTLPAQGRDRLPSACPPPRRTVGL
jgi:tetratricopeptide (TPR) repeat protein